MDKPEITYISDNAADYVAGLKASQTLEALRAFVAEHRYLAADAFEAVHSINFDWDKFVAGRRLENKGECAGDDWVLKYGAIMMPEILIRVGIVAHQFGVPWGCAYIRMRDEGLIAETETHAKFVNKEKQQ